MITFCFGGSDPKGGRDSLHEPVLRLGSARVLRLRSVVGLLLRSGGGGGGGSGGSSSSSSSSEEEVAVEVVVEVVVAVAILAVTRSYQQY